MSLKKMWEAIEPVLRRRGAFGHERQSGSTLGATRAAEWLRQPAPIYFEDGSQPSVVEELQDLLWQALDEITRARGMIRDRDVIPLDWGGVLLAQEAAADAIDQALALLPEEAEA